MEAPLSATATEILSGSVIRENMALEQLINDNYKIPPTPVKADEAIIRARELYFNRDRLLPF